jgi:hypothetical protein
MSNKYEILREGVTFENQFQKEHMENRIYQTMIYFKLSTDVRNLNGMKCHEYKFEEN